MYRVWYRHYTMSSAVMTRVKESELREGEHRWRRYCGLGNFNIDLASYCVKITSHNKKKYVRENIGPDSCEYGIPNRCPLLKEK